MADQNPGQIISPGGQSEDPSKTTQEVSVSSQQPMATPPSPQQTQVAVPAPQPASPQVVSQPMATVTPETAQLQAPLTSQNTQQQDSSNEQSFASGFSTPPNNEDTFSPYDHPASVSPNSEESISWTASEYIAHHKSPVWFLALAVATVAVSVGVYFLTSGDILATVVIVLVAIVFGIFAGKQPKEQSYSVSPAGVTIGAKGYAFDQFKTFSIIDEGVFSNITFLPMKRFMPTISIYYDPKDEEQIVETLSNYLPMDIHKRDFVDNLMRKIRF